MDCVLIQGNRAHEIWRNTAKSQLAGKYTQAILDVIVETTNPVEVGFTWNGSAFLGQRWIIHTATGEFVSGGYFDPVLPDGDHSIVNTGTTTPNLRTEKWNGSAIVGKTAQEIASYDAAFPKYLDGRELMRRLAATTHLGMEKLSQTDATTAKLWNTLKVGGPVDIHSVEFANGAGYLASVGIGPDKVWADQAAYDADLAAIKA